MNAEADKRTGRFISVMPIAERFWSKVEKGDGCWLWTSTKTRRGYGHFTISAGRRTSAHRFSWESANGPIPSGLYVCHRCDNPRCVRPDHLFLGTNDDNMADKKAKGRNVSGKAHHWSKNPRRGERNNRSKLTDAQVEAIRALQGPGWTYRHEVAAKFGISQAHVWRIWRNKTRSNQ